MKKVIALISVGIIAVFMTVYLTSCTFSLQNISTHGTATDLVDENLSATASPDIAVSGV